MGTQTVRQLSRVRRLGLTAAALLGAISARPAAAAPTVPAIPVTVTNTPTVNANVTNTAIGVKNTSAAPLFVTTQSAASGGMGSFCDVRLAAGATDGTVQCQVGVVPVGKVLVVETMTCFAQVVDGTPFNGLVFTVGAPNPAFPAAGKLSTLNHFLPLARNPNGDYGGINAYAMISPVRIYAFGGDPATGGDVPIYVFGNVGTNPTNTVPSLGCTISGHYESQ